MKKLIAILAVMIVLVGAVFAATTDNKLVLKSTVGKVAPIFTINLGSDAGTAAGNEVAISEDISEEDVVKVFTILQTGTSPKLYAKYKGSVTLTVQIGPFKANFVDGENTTTVEQSTTYAIIAQVSENGAKTVKGDGYAPNANDKRLVIANGNGNSGAPIIDASDAHKASVTLTYNGKKVLDSDAGTIATIVAKWNKDEDLPMEGNGTVYKAEVKLSYETN